ncbi:hypothetical protein KEM56_005853 [Ascosphaera pollenicola]|nr:hypothetical protein KEM56_005853 [Ascosphaera pollenicola]
MADLENQRFQLDRSRQSSLENQSYFISALSSAAHHANNSRSGTYIPSSNVTLSGSTTEIDFEGTQTPPVHAVDSGTNLFMRCHDEKHGNQRKTMMYPKFSPKPMHPDASPPAPSSPEKVSTRERFRHFTWAWYTSCMSTGGVAILLHVVPYKFNGIEYIGRVFYILQLCLFIGIMAALTYRFISFPGALVHSLTHHIEGLFVPTISIALATVLSNARIYGGPHCGPWLDTVLRICFWIYSAVTFVVAVAQYQYIFENRILNMENMTPGWLLPVFAPMMAGTIAINIADFQPREQALPICMFIAVGPPSFTAFVIIDLAKIATHKLGETGRDVSWLNLFAVLAASTILIISVWFVALTLAGLIPQARALQFKLAWWALVFPNIGFTIAVITVAKAFDCVWLKWVGTIFVIIMVAMWVFVGVNHVVAVWKGRIMWPGRDEDV